MELNQSVENIKLHENKKADELGEEYAYGNYVTQRLKYIKNPNVKQNIKLEIDNIFYFNMKQSSQENTEL